MPESDRDWQEKDWSGLLRLLVDEGFVSWRDIAALTLGHINPSQVGTSIASKKSFQRHFAPRKCWAAVRKWHFERRGQCVDCNTRLELQADHVVPREIVGKIGEAMSHRLSPGVDAESLCLAIEHALELALVASGGISESLRKGLARDLAERVVSGEHSAKQLSSSADRLDNLVLRCRRCNVIRRPSHLRGGQTYLTAESALMWLLLVKRPPTYQDFQVLCRNYGMTMASIRFEEAWAMAIWLSRIGKYDIDPACKYAP